MGFEDEKRTVYQALRLLNTEQLNTIIRRHDWMDVEIVGLDRDQKAEKIRDKAETYLIGRDDPKEGDGNPEWADFRKYVLDDIVAGGYGKDILRIEQVLERTDIRPLNQQPDDEESDRRAKKEEEWYSAQLYGALYNEFYTPNRSHSGLTPNEYSVYREHEKWGLHVDLFVRNERTGDFYLIEVKRAAQIDDLEDVEDQLKRYNAVFSKQQGAVLCLLYNEKEEIIKLAESARGTTIEGLDGAVDTIDIAIQSEIGESAIVASEIDSDPEY